MKYSKNLEKEHMVLYTKHMISKLNNLLQLKRLGMNCMKIKVFLKQPLEKY